LFGVLDYLTRISVLAPAAGAKMTHLIYNERGFILRRILRDGCRSLRVIDAMSDAQSSDWLKIFTALGAISDPVWRKIVKSAQHIRLPAGARIFRDGEACQYYLLVVEGSVQVQKTTSDGHEIVLYHVNAGQTCELTTSCMLGGKKYVADAIANTPIHVVLISKEHFIEAMGNLPAFREFVYSSLDKGVTDMVSLVENVAFGHLDQRLAHQLIERRAEQNLVMATHQDFARELGTAREVISRMLKEFERNDWVKLHRGWIEIKDEPALKALIRRSGNAVI
jgi:CRP/FNR family transcriptional regulator, anaerobic regulatory protein